MNIDEEINVFSIKWYYYNILLFAVWVIRRSAVNGTYVFYFIISHIRCSSSSINLFDDDPIAFDEFIVFREYSFSKCSCVSFSLMHNCKHFNKIGLICKINSRTSKLDFSKQTIVFDLIMFLFTRRLKFKYLIRFICGGSREQHWRIETLSHTMQAHTHTQTIIYIFFVHSWF